jgi:hypothetical protein
MRDPVRDRRSAFRRFACRAACIAVLLAVSPGCRRGADRSAGARAEAPFDPLGPIERRDLIGTMFSLDRIDRRVAAREALADPVARAKALRDAAARLLDPLTTLYSLDTAPAAARAVAANLLLRLCPGITDDARADALTAQVLVPVLQAGGPLTEEGDPRLAATACLATLAPRLTAVRAADALSKAIPIARAVRHGWACDDRATRLRRRASVVRLQEQALRTILHATGPLLARGLPPALQAEAVAMLGDALRESPETQDASLHQAAADALVDAAPALEREAADRAAEPLVDALFINTIRYPGPSGARSAAESRGPSDFAQIVPLAPWARRTLVRLALVDDAAREAVVRELLRALLVDTPAADQAAVPALAAVGANERVALRALPCGGLLGVACPRGAGTLREFMARGDVPQDASCNAGQDPDLRDGTFDAGFEPGRIRDAVGTVLEDVLPRARDEAFAHDDSFAAAAVALLARQVHTTDEWVAQVEAARELHDAVGALYPELLSEPPPVPVVPETPAIRQGPRPAHPSPAVRQAFEAMRLLVPPFGRPATATELREAARTLLQALHDPAARPADREIARPLFRPLVAELETDLLRLADFANEYDAVDVRLWRTALAARTLSLLGAAGPDDETLRALLRITRFAFDARAGFPVRTHRAFPPLLLRFRARFTSDGTALQPRPVAPVLVEIIGAFRRPTREVLDFLLGLMADGANAEDGIDVRGLPSSLAAPRGWDVGFAAALSFSALFPRMGVEPGAEVLARRFGFEARSLGVDALAVALGGPSDCTTWGGAAAACWISTLSRPDAAVDPDRLCRGVLAVRGIVALADAGDAEAKDALCAATAAADLLPGALRDEVTREFRRVSLACDPGGWGPIREAVLASSDPAAGRDVANAVLADYGPRDAWLVLTEGGRPVDVRGRGGPQPRLRLRDPAVMGALRWGEVRRVVEDRQEALLRCYQTSLRMVADLAGRIVMRFRVSGGAADAVTWADNGTGDERLARCVARVFRRTGFPRKAVATTCAYPMEFELVPPR